MKTYNTLFFGTPDFAVPSLAALLSIPEINIKAVFKFLGNQNIFQLHVVGKPILIGGIVFTMN